MMNNEYDKENKRVIDFWLFVSKPTGCSSICTGREEDGEEAMMGGCKGGGVLVLCGTC